MNPPQAWTLICLKKSGKYFKKFKKKKTLAFCIRLTTCSKLRPCVMKSFLFTKAKRRRAELRKKYADISTAVLWNRLLSAWSAVEVSLRKPRDKRIFPTHSSHVPAVSFSSQTQLAQNIGADFLACDG